MAPDHGAAFVKVRCWKAHAKAEHATGLRLQRDHLVVQVFGRGHPGALGVERNQKRKAPCLHGALAACTQMLAQQQGGPLAGLGHVDVRVGAVGDQAIRQLQHALGHVGVQVQAGDNGCLGANHGADAGDQLTFAVVGVFGHGRAVQIEVHPVQALHHGRTNVFDDGRTNALKRVLGHVRRGRGTGPGRGHQLPAFAPRRVDEAARRDVHARHLLDQGLTAHIGRKGLAALKGRPIGQAGCKGVGLVLVTSDQDTGHGGTCSGFNSGHSSCAIAVQLQGAGSRGGKAAGAASSRRRV